MVSPQKRRMKKKFNKVSADTKREYFRPKNKRASCAITGEALAGVPHETQSGLRKKSKSEKRPSAPFGGVLSGKARHKVFIEVGKVVAGIKGIDDVDQKYRTYVKQAMARTENK